MREWQQAVKDGGTTRVVRRGLYNKQYEFRKLKVSFRGFCAGRGSGKSEVGADYILSHAVSGDPWLAISPDANVVMSTTWPIFERLAKERGRWLRGIKSPVPQAWFRTNDGGVANIMFKSAELRSILGAAGVPMRAFVLLGVNAAFGATDIANLPQAAVDLQDGWIDYARGKTGIGRRIPLWPETAAAIQEAIQQRPKAKDKADEDLAFLTRFGTRWVKLNHQAGREGATPDDALGKEFNKLLIALGIKRAGLRFYALRHTFRTVADEAKDQPVVGHIMGHHDPTMAAVYRERIGDERLRAVVDHVRGWLFPARVKDSDEEPAGGAATAGDLQDAIQRIHAAITAATGPTRRTLEAVWQPEIELAEAGDLAVRRRLLEHWRE